MANGKALTLYALPNGKALTLYAVPNGKALTLYALPNGEALTLYALPNGKALTLYALPNGKALTLYALPKCSLLSKCREVQRRTRKCNLIHAQKKITPLHTKNFRAVQEHSTALSEDFRVQITDRNSFTPFCQAYTTAKPIFTEIKRAR